MGPFGFRAFKILLFCCWVAYFWCVFAPLALGTIEQIFRIGRSRRR